MFKIWAPRKTKMSRDIIVCNGLGRNDKLTESKIISSFDFVSNESEEFETKFSVLAKSCLKQKSKSNSFSKALSITVTNTKNFE